MTVVEFGEGRFDLGVYGFDQWPPVTVGDDQELAALHGFEDLLTDAVGIGALGPTADRLHDGTDGPQGLAAQMFSATAKVAADWNGVTDPIRDLASLMAQGRHANEPTPHTSDAGQFLSPNSLREADTRKCQLSRRSRVD